MTRASVSQASVSQASVSQASASQASSAGPAPVRGGYACGDVDVAALRNAGGAPAAASQGLELSLALPFGQLFSALLPERSFRVRQLHLDYVDAERLGERATYSAQIGATLEQGQAVELRLLVARGAWLCVRGRAVLELGAASQPHQGNSHG